MNYKFYSILSFFICQTLSCFCQSDSMHTYSEKAEIREIDSVNTIFFNREHQDIKEEVDNSPTINWEIDTTDAIPFITRFSFRFDIGLFAANVYTRTDSLVLLGVGNRAGHIRNTNGMPSGLSLQCQLTKKMYLQLGCNLFQNEITLRDDKIIGDRSLINTVAYDGKTVVKYKTNSFQFPVSVCRYSTEQDHSFYMGAGLKANIIFYESMTYQSETDFSYVAGVNEPFYKTTFAQKTNKKNRFYNLTPTFYFGGAYTPNSKMSILYFGSMDGFPVLKNKESYFNISYLQLAGHNISFVYYF